MFKSNRQLLAEFSAKTGIRDGKVDAMVAGFDSPDYHAWKIRHEMATTATSEPAHVLSREDIEKHLDSVKRASEPYRGYRLGMDVGPGKDYSRINWNFGSQKNIDSYWAELWRAFITYRFKQGLEAGFAHSRQEEDEVDLREVYETEWRLKDILPKDGWTPHED